MCLRVFCVGMHPCPCVYIHMRKCQSVPDPFSSVLHKGLGSATPGLASLFQEPPSVRLGSHMRAPSSQPLPYPLPPSLGLGTAEMRLEAVIVSTGNR